jgi:hypothetical protein
MCGINLTDGLTAVAALATAAWAGATFAWQRSAALGAIETSLALRRREMLDAHESFAVRRLSSCRQLYRIAEEAYLSELDLLAGRIRGLWSGEAKFKARYAVTIQEGLAWRERYLGTGGANALGRTSHAFPNLVALAARWKLKASFSPDLLPQDGPEEDPARDD